MKLVRVLCTAPLIALFASCATGGPAPAQPVSVKALHRSAQCGAANAHATVVYLFDAAAFARVIENLRHTAGSDRRPTPSVDFMQQAALLVQMGQKPTAGYSLGSEQPVAHVRDDTLEIVLNWQVPSPGSMLAQVMTSPCMVIAIPRTGYKTIHVLDAAGQVRASTTR